MEIQMQRMSGAAIVPQPEAIAHRCGHDPGDASGSIAPT